MRGEGANEVDPLSGGLLAGVLTLNTALGAGALADRVVPSGEPIGVELGTPPEPGWSLFGTAAYGGTSRGTRDGCNIPS